MMPPEFLLEGLDVLTKSASVIAAWLIVFIMPYLLDSIGPNIGWVFGSVAAISVVWTYFFVPELQGRSLEVYIFRSFFHQGLVHVDPWMYKN